MTIQYYKSGDFYLPNLTAEEIERPIGKYGRLHRQYLKDHRPIIFTTLLLSGNLYQHLTEINRACTERVEFLTEQMANRKGVTEALKATDQMAWVQSMNSIKNSAEEIVLSELVYC